MRNVIVILALLAVAVSSAAHGDLPKLVKKEYVYKNLRDLEIKADVYRWEDTEVRPVVAWFHGGGLIHGARDKTPKDLYDWCERKGYILISFDYRLAPEVKLPAILEDVKDAITWIRENGHDLFQANPERIVVVGGSAGGYLALMSGCIVKPPPTAIVSYWGYGDVSGTWYTEPSAHYTRTYRPISKDTAQKLVGEKVRTNVTWKTGGKQRSRYYIYLRQTGNWTEAVTGIDPSKFPKKLYPFNPVRNLSALFPSTILIHGKEDEDVPYQKSLDMAKALDEAGTAHKLIGIDKGMHGLRGGNREQIKKGRREILDFITRHLEKR